MLECMSARSALSQRSVNYNNLISQVIQHFSCCILCPKLVIISYSLSHFCDLFLIETIKTGICFIWRFWGQSNNLAPVLYPKKFFRAPRGPKKSKRSKNLTYSGIFWLTLDDSGWLLMNLADSGWLWLTLADSGWVWMTLLTLYDSGGLWLTQADSYQLWQTQISEQVVKMTHTKTKYD